MGCTDSKATIDAAASAAAGAQEEARANAEADFQTRLAQVLARRAHSLVSSSPEESVSGGGKGAKKKKVVMVKKRKKKTAQQNVDDESVPDATPENFYSLAPTTLHPEDSAVNNPLVLSDVPLTETVGDSTTAGVPRQRSFELTPTHRDDGSARRPSDRMNMSLDALPIGV